MFKEYMEDYNTATFPHEKYYDVERFEMMELKKKQEKKKRKQGDKVDALADEEVLRKERLRLRAEKERKEFELVLQTMDRDKIEHMRHQEKLRYQMQMHFKAGNLAEARRLEHLLNKVDEDKKR